MSQMTITEALAELKTLGKRLAKKQEFLVANVVRPGMVLDPLAKEGGSEALIKSERQAFNDLLLRLQNIRVRIQESNQKSTLKIGNLSKTVAEWLAWRKECAQIAINLNKSLLQQIRLMRQKVEQGVPADKKGDPNFGVIAHASEVELAKEAENLEQILGDLDGKLSHFNATTNIDV